MKIEEKIKKIFADILQVEEHSVSDETTPEDFPEWDSINHLTLIAAFEEEFSVDIEPEIISKMMENYDAFKKVVLNRINSI